MKTYEIRQFSDKEEEFANLLIEIGTKKNIAKILIFLAGSPEATSRTIEQGTELRQPEISIAMRSFMNRGWIKSRECKAESKGRPVKIYLLAKPIGEIMESIESEKSEEAIAQLTMLQKLRDYLA